ncbi:hypothetical protein ATANTOWER_000738 [Ataeniobius toweri]|uniref:Uncharacterized protein n=1 Tax=Ataeniobius toweri TaxID=208326 RepID=A0ABU7ALC5_9TELE|nr:hypothetical protein [Ataeniobius toweri]
MQKVKTNLKLKKKKNKAVMLHFGQLGMGCTEKLKQWQVTNVASLFLSSLSCCHIKTPRQHRQAPKQRHFGMHNPSPGARTNELPINKIRSQEQHCLLQSLQMKRMSSRQDSGQDRTSSQVS